MIYLSYAKIPPNIRCLVKQATEEHDEVVIDMKSYLWQNSALLKRTFEGLDGSKIVVDARDTSLLLEINEYLSSPASIKKPEPSWGVNIYPYYLDYVIIITILFFLGWLVGAII